MKRVARLLVFVVFTVSVFLLGGKFGARHAAQANSTAFENGYSDGLADGMSTCRWIREL